MKSFCHCNINNQWDFLLNQQEESASVVLTTNSSSVDGVFLVIATFDTSITGLTTSDVSVINGSCEYVHTYGGNVYYLFINPTGAGDVTTSIPANSVTPNNTVSNSLVTTIDSAWGFLVQTSTSNLYYDFRELSGLTGDAAITDNLGLFDQSGNSRNLARINSPVINQGTAGLTRALDTSNNAYSSAVTGSTFFNQDFSINFKVASADGQPPETWHICGNREAVNIGLVISIQTTGRLRISYMTFQWDSTSAVFPNGATSDSYFDIHFDFTNDTLSVYQDGAAVAGSFTTSNISAVNPATFSMSQNFYICALNSNGTVTSNSVNHYMYYFLCTKLQTSNISSIRTYLEAKKPTVEFISKLTDANALNCPHDIIVSTDGANAFVSGKGDPLLTTVDGSFGILNLSNPQSISVEGSYYGQGDQKDGETVLQLSSTRVLHFCDTQVLLFDTSTPATPTLVKTVSHATGLTPDVVNGAIKIGTHVFGANKSGYITVLDVSDIDNFTLTGNYDAYSEIGTIGPHDIDITADGEHIVFCSRKTGNENLMQVAIIKVYNSGSLIPLASWSAVSTITSVVTPDLSSSNRLRVIGNTLMIHTLQNTGKNIVSYDITDISSPVYKDSFNLNYASGHDASAGACIYRDKYDIVANGIGIRLLDFSDSADLKQWGGAWNSTLWTAGANTNFHDIDWFHDGTNRYFIVTAQNDNSVGIYKLNRI